MERGSRELGPASALQSQETSSPKLAGGKCGLEAIFGHSDEQKVVPSNEGEDGIMFCLQREV